MKLKTEPKFHEWCHFCGGRDTGPFAEVWYPDNAEHETVDRHYIRFCSACVGRIHAQVAQTSEHGKSVWS
jgi:hypothetical protein